MWEYPDCMHYISVTKHGSGICTSATPDTGLLEQPAINTLQPLLMYVVHMQNTPESGLFTLKIIIVWRCMK